LFRLAHSHKFTQLRLINHKVEANRTNHIKVSKEIITADLSRRVEEEETFNVEDHPRLHAPRIAAHGAAKRSTTRKTAPQPIQVAVDAGRKGIGHQFAGHQMFTSPKMASPMM
jgi:hypothetical protein